MITRSTSLRHRVEVILCESRDETNVSKLAPMLLLTRTMEIYQSLGLSEEIEQESERYFYFRPLCLLLQMLRFSRRCIGHGISLCGGCHRYVLADAQSPRARAITSPPSIFNTSHADPHFTATGQIHAVDHAAI